MKKLIAFFVFIYKWVVALFSPNPMVKKEEAKEELKEAIAEATEERDWTGFRNRHRLIPQHNNRKNTRGRRTQHIPYHAAIYHEPNRTKGTV